MAVPFLTTFLPVLLRRPAATPPLPPRYWIGDREVTEAEYKAGMLPPVPQPIDLSSPTEPTYAATRRAMSSNTLISRAGDYYGWDR